MSQSKRIFLNPPHQSGGEQQWLAKVLESNYLAPVGPMLSEFEQALGRALRRGDPEGGPLNDPQDVWAEKGDGAHRGDKTILPIALNSGTSAIHLALRLIGVQRGDVVLCQSMTFAGSAFPINYLGAEPIFIDSSAGSFNMDPGLFEQAIIDCIHEGRKPKAIIAVHLYGFSYDITRIHQIARTYDIPIIEDAAEALGSVYGGKSCGTFGDYGVLSFNGNKIITTAGGGALLVKDPILRQRALYLAQQAKSPADHYHHREVGYNYRMPSLNAALGCAQLQTLEQRLSQKKEIHLRYQALVKSYNGIEIYSLTTLFKEVEHVHENEQAQAHEHEYQPNHWLNILILDPKYCTLSPSEVVAAFEKADIEARRLWKPMHLQPLYNKAKAYVNGVSQQWFDSALCLPSGTAMTPEDWVRIEQVFDTLFTRG
ncbi:MAG: DegT/DnrJ/EryC1/StrS family aminotransferase [Bacteroidetes bacterium]|nr:DegT/DnrJ/EryC1/StrS family aminotransferase [Bacteroidota bacterium]